jgi:UDPglucose 6-dehydrogenase
MINNQLKTGFVGLTHLGIVSGICWASEISPVIAFDNRRAIVERLEEAILSISEPKLADIFHDCKNQIFFTDDFRQITECEIVFLTQDIKTNEHNISDYNDLYNLIDEITPHLRNDAVIVVMSQISIGTCRVLKQKIKDARSGLSFELVYMVETLIIGDAVNRFLKPERIILGTEDGTLNKKHDLLKLHIEKLNVPLIVMKYESAELTKLAINFYLFSSVMYANTIADICESYGANINEIIPALRSDKRIGQYAYIHPGLGVMGGNLERDMMSLIGLEKNMKLNSDLVETMVNQNKSRYTWIERKLKKHLLDHIKKPKICIWGLAYKKDTASLKNAVSKYLIDDLSDMAKFSAYDPLVKEMDCKGLEICKDKYVALVGAHCLIVLNDSDEFKDIDILELNDKMSDKLVIDCANVFASRSDEFKSINYISIGRA